MDIKELLPQMKRILRDYCPRCKANAAAYNLKVEQQKELFLLFCIPQLIVFLIMLNS